MNTKSQIDFDRLLQLHMLDQTGEYKDMSWECHKIVDYSKKMVILTYQIIGV
jgi:hypothetical protein